jgi:hypothetical protein
MISHATRTYPFYRPGSQNLQSKTFEHVEAKTPEGVKVNTYDGGYFSTSRCGEISTITSVARSGFRLVGRGGAFPAGFIARQAICESGRRWPGAFLAGSYKPAGWIFVLDGIEAALGVRGR